MKTRLGTLAVTGIILVALTACVPCGVPLQVVERSSSALPSATTAPTALPRAQGGVSPALDPQQVVIDVYQRANPAVVNVRVTKRNEGSFRFQPQQGEPPDEYVRGQGSGFLIDHQGHVVTNNHVAEGAEEVLVVFSDGAQARAKVLGLDPDSDLAVLQLAPPWPDVTPLDLGDSSTVQVGQLAIAIGNPFGLQGTLTTGIVSSVGRTLPLGRQSTAVGGRFSIPSMIQTDAAINPGNSGGPLLNAQGQVVGINTAINAIEGVNSGVGFAVPADLIRRVVPSLIKDGRYAYPWLGVSGSDVNPDIVDAMKLPERRGALIVQVIKGSPADRAGLHGSNQTVTLHEEELEIGGDVITGIDGVPIKRFDDLLIYLVEKTTVGQTVQLTVLRDGKTMTVPIRLVERPQD